MVEGEKKQAIETLYRKVTEDPEYRSEAMGTIFVPGDGSTEARIVLVGEAPGRDEELQGRPFVGAAGRNLARLLERIGLSRKDVFITNLVKYRPFEPDGKNRKPTLRESKRALPYLTEELRLLEPDLVVCLGSSAAAMLLDRPSLRMSQANGEVFEKDGLRILVSYHPSPYNYLSPEKRAAMETAFETLAALLRQQ
jgi:uracil-DNA glycosylase family 4